MNAAGKCAQQERPVQDRESREGGVGSAFSCEKGLQLLRCYSSADLVEGRIDNLAVLNLGRPLDKFCHGLQHFGVMLVL